MTKNIEFSYNETHILNQANGILRQYAEMTDDPVIRIKALTAADNIHNIVILSGYPEEERRNIE